MTQSEHAPSPQDDPSVMLSANRTEMSLVRTALSSDRTLMSVVRTSLSMISFGFTIYQVFHTLTTTVATTGLPRTVPRTFASALIALGILMLLLGIHNHMRETSLRRGRRRALLEAGLIHDVGSTHPSSTMIIAVLLLILGFIAIARVAFSFGPF